MSIAYYQLSIINLKNQKPEAGKESGAGKRETEESRVGDLLTMVLVLGGYVVVMRYLLPKLGVDT